MLPTMIETVHKVHLDGLSAENGRALWQYTNLVSLERFTDFAGTVVLVHDSIGCHCRGGWYAPTWVEPRFKQFGVALKGRGGGQEQQQPRNPGSEPRFNPGRNPGSNPGLTQSLTRFEPRF